MKLTQNRENQQTIAPCWNLCFSSYTCVRNLKTAKNMESRGSPETISIHEASVHFASPELTTMDSSLSLVFICTAREVIWLFSCFMAPCIAIHCSLPFIEEELEQNFTRTAKQRRHLSVPTWHSRFKGFLHPGLGPSQMGGVLDWFLWVLFFFSQSPKIKTSPRPIK